MLGKAHGIAMIPWGSGNVQGMVYVFIGLMGVGVGAAAYYLLAFTPIESGVLTLLVALAGIIVHERNQRLRFEARVHKAIDDLGTLLSTDAKAGQVLSRRVNALEDIAPRVDVIEADMSVLGTVIRQVAEAVSELESQTAQPPAQLTPAPEPQPSRRFPTIPLDTVRKALDNGRLLVHAQAIVTLPQRRTHAYMLIPRLALDGGRLVDPPEYMPVPNAEGRIVIRRIERVLAEEGVKIVRRARLLGEQIRLLIDISAATLSDRSTIDQLIAVLGDNRAVAPDLCFALTYEDWSELEKPERDMLARLVQQGIGLAIRDLTTLRLDFNDLVGFGVRYLMVDGETFLRAPSRLTDFHSSDIGDYIRRFGATLVMTGLETEQQVLALLDDDIKMAQGRVLAAPGPLRADLTDDDNDEMRRAAGR